jgi:hypothetical protein
MIYLDGERRTCFVDMSEYEQAPTRYANPLNFGLRILQSEDGIQDFLYDEFCLRNAAEAAIILNGPQIDPSS